MIHRDKPNTPPPALMVNKWNDIKAKVLTQKNAHEADNKCYRDTTIDSLMKLYENKCAICERKYGTELQVDHFRPKKQRNNKTKIKYNQPGYYWLTYEWENLIPLCSRCNLKKSNKFPLKGWSEINRISNHININNLPEFKCTDLKWLQQNEQPLMINPEIELNPAKHFIFVSNGKMIGRTDEGCETIRICDLNRRDLKRERIEVRQGYVTAIKSAFDFYSINKTNNESGARCELKGELRGIFRNIKINCRRDKAYSLFHVYIYKYFRHHIGFKLPEPIRENAVNYFDEFKSFSK